MDEEKTALMIDIQTLRQCAQLSKIGDMGSNGMVQERRTVPVFKVGGDFRLSIFHPLCFTQSLKNGKAYSHCSAPSGNVWGSKLVLN
jgi:hypothetical protein